MNKQITDKVYCVLLRSGVRIWINESGLNTLTPKLKASTGNSLFEIEGQLVNGTDVNGVFTAEKIDELDKMKRGMWRCKYGSWHNRYDNCDCGRIPEHLRG